MKHPGVAKCCINCLYLIDRGKSIINWDCQLHGSEARITHPSSQFCGDEYWVSVKLKTRIDNLEKLGI